MELALHHQFSAQILQSHTDFSEITYSRQLKNKLFCSFKLFFTQPFSSSLRLHEFSVQKHKYFAILILTEKKEESYLLCILAYKLQLHSPYIQILCPESQRGREILGKGKQVGGDRTDSDSKGKNLCCTLFNYFIA